MTDRNFFNNSDEIERNRRKVMEINFFLDNQQISFDNQTSEMQIILSEVAKDDQSDEKAETIGKTTTLELDK